MRTNLSWKYVLTLTIILILTGIGLLLWWNNFEDTQLSGRLIEFESTSAENLEGFTPADGVIPLPFPETFGPHNDFRTEWWYYTGNLETEEGRHFGYQLTFFRQALVPQEQILTSESQWRTDQLYFAHFTLTDVAAEQFTFYERFARAGAELAGAKAQPYQVWLEDWEVRQIADGRYQLTAQQDHIALSLTLVDEKGPVLQGDGGYSQKGPHPGNASYYYSQPRLRSTGTISLGEEMFEVSGWSWKDHEFSTSALSDDLVGWDWFSLQLDDGMDLMLYSLRREDGSIDEYSSGAVINSNGQISQLDPDEFTITTLDRWVSPETSAEYPSKWRIQIPSSQIDLTITPYLPDQELLVTVIYWEGAVQVTGTHGNNQVNGAGYVELTGYFQSMKSWF